VHLCILFNALLSHSFVPSDFCKGIIVPLLKSKHGDATQLDLYRGITLSPVLSKLFEMVLLHLFEEFLVSDDLQFGFKKRSSCSHALLAFSESIKYFTSNRNKVYAAFLDASKAFDKVLHNCLFVKLLRKNVPVCLVLLLRSWYSQLQCVVRRQNNYGDSFQVLCGVRQRGVLSPYLFALYIDDLIDSLRLSEYGLYVSQLFIGCLLYADDIVLLSPSCFGLRHLVSICEHFGRYWDIKFNHLKSQLTTFGGSNPNVNINMNSSTIPWVNKVKYLGVYFLSNSGKTDLTDTMRRFYGSLITLCQF